MSSRDPRFFGECSIFNSFWQRSNAAVAECHVSPGSAVFTRLKISDTAMTVSTEQSSQVLPRTLGGLLYAKRKQEGWSIQEMADRLKISKPYLADLERGRRHPSPQVLRSIAEFLRISARDLSKLDPRVPMEDLR